MVNLTGFNDSLYFTKKNGFSSTFPEISQILNIIQFF